MKQQKTNIQAKEVTPEMIAAWKAQYEPTGRSIHRLWAGAGDEKKVCYIVSPDRKTMSFASTAGAKDALKFNEVILSDGWLAGDEEILTNVGLSLSVGDQITTIVGIVESGVEKL